MAQHLSLQACLKPMVECSVICGWNGKHSLILPLLGFPGKHRKADSGSLFPVLRISLLTRHPLAPQTACCLTYTASQWAALALLGSSMGQASLPTLPQPNCSTVCPAWIQTTGSPSPLTLSRGDFIYYSNGEMSLRWAASNRVWTWNKQDIVPLQAFLPVKETRLKPTAS